MALPTRAATALLQLGLIAIVFAALPYKVFELDRYLVPKELVLHVVSLSLAIALLPRTRTTKLNAADMLLAAFLIWSFASALFATNHWLAQRAVSLSVASAVVFWGAKRLGAEGAHRKILVAAAVATVCAAVTGLAQAYGLENDYFSANRAPGGTFGNRNFVAHFCAIGLPALVYATVTARRPLAALAGSLSCGAVVALLVLSRSRASWLAVSACTVVLVLPLFASRKYWGGQRIGGRFARIALSAAVAAFMAAYLPNSLNWRSDSPYLDSALRMVDYASGSGRGRVAQYLNSARMAADDPLLGVGPGNWPVRYVRFARASDPSIADDGMTANPWPSSDWVAFVSERGTVGAIALAGAFVFLFISAFRRWNELPDSGAVLAKVAQIGTIAATLVVSAFDAVLLLAAPALLAWSVIGATSGIVGIRAAETGATQGVGRGGRDVTFPRGPWRVAVALLLLVQTLSVVRSATQVAAIATVGQGGSRAAWTAAAALDPGSYRINLRAAEMQWRSGRCTAARVYARQAVALYPHAAAPKRVLRVCS
ncbi:MAG: O-antigen ligase family protein [Gemmatimonadaceae bacterium]